MSAIQDRLATFLAEYNLSAQAFERKCNIGVATASKLSESSRATTFAKIEKAYPELNINWLKTGEGAMLNPQPQKKIEVGFGIGEQSGGQSDFKFELKEENNSSVNKIEVDEICNLKREIEHLSQLLKERDSRVAELKEALDRAHKMNDYLMGQK